MTLIAFIPPATNAHTRGPVPVWPYILGSFFWNTWVVCAVVFANRRWGITAPALFGFLNACVSVSLAATLFFRNHHRRLLPTERQRFTFGCFLAFWFYDEFLRLVLTVMHGESTPKGIATGIVATAVDFALVWLIVWCTDVWAAKRLAAA